MQSLNEVVQATSRDLSMTDGKLIETNRWHQEKHFYQLDFKSANPEAMETSWGGLCSALYTKGLNNDNDDDIVIGNVLLSYVMYHC